MKTLIPLIIAFITFTGYLFLIIKKIGLQKSISFSDEVFEKPYKFFFELTMFICGGCMAWYGDSVCSIPIFLGGVLIFCIGLFPLGDRPKWVKIPHMFFAISGYSILFLGVLFDLYGAIDNQIFYCFVILITIIALIIINKAKKPITGIEVMLSYTIFLSILIQIFITFT